jgi:hypothetical protein
MEDDLSKAKQSNELKGPLQLGFEQSPGRCPEEAWPNKESQMLLCHWKKKTINKN